MFHFDVLHLLCGSEPSQLCVLAQCCVSENPGTVCSLESCLLGQATFNMRAKSCGDLRTKQQGFVREKHHVTVLLRYFNFASLHCSSIPGQAGYLERRSYKFSLRASSLQVSHGRIAGAANERIGILPRLT